MIAVTLYDTRHSPAARWLALLLLVLLPFPVSLPLAMWLTGRDIFGRNSPSGPFHP